MDNAIEVLQTTKQFSGKTILDEIDLNVKRGEIIGLLGPSGAGKTTLVKLIIGMGSPDSGEIKVLGQKMPNLQTVNDIGYMAQSDALYEDLTARDNILFFAELYGWSGEKALQRADEILKLVKLEQDALRPIKNFSGGMKRRLSLAIALFHKPQVLILDEPTVGIDPLLRKLFWNEFATVKSQGTTILITTHVMDEAEHCDRLALMRDGKIIALDTPQNLKQQAGGESIDDAFLFFATQSPSQGEQS